MTIVSVDGRRAISGLSSRRQRRERTHGGEAGAPVGLAVRLRCVQRRAQHLDRRDLAGNRAFAFGDQTELGVLQPAGDRPFRAANDRPASALGETAADRLGCPNMPAPEAGRVTFWIFPATRGSGLLGA